MITLKEAIEHCKEIALTCNNKECALDHFQLFKWLEEYQNILEKQGEQKSIWHNEDEEPQRGSLILLIMQSGNPIVAKIIEPNHTFNHGERWAYIDDLLEKQCEQKSAEWSEDDNKLIDCVIELINDGALDRDEKDYLIEKLKSLKDKVQPQPNQVWSEKDGNLLSRCICDFDYLIKNENRGFEERYKEQIDWLKSLRPQSQWKPNLPQLNALGVVTKGNAPDDIEEINSLYNDLKKLREE